MAPRTLALALLALALAILEEHAECVGARHVVPALDLLLDGGQAGRAHGRVAFFERGAVRGEAGGASGILWVVRGGQVVGEEVGGERLVRPAAVAEYGGRPVRRWKSVLLGRGSSGEGAGVEALVVHGGVVGEDLSVGVVAVPAVAVWASEGARVLWVYFRVAEKACLAGGPAEELRHDGGGAGASRRGRGGWEPRDSVADKGHAA